MNLIFLPFINEVAGADTSAVFEAMCNLVLNLAELCCIYAVLVVAIAIARNFDCIEWQLVTRLVPPGSPELCHGLETLEVFLLIADIAFALIPQETFDGIAHERVKHAIVHHHLSVIISVVDRSKSVGISLENLFWQPSLDTASAPRAVDDAHRDVEQIGKSACKEIADSAETLGILRFADFPFASHLILWDKGIGLWYCCKAYGFLVLA